MNPSKTAKYGDEEVSVLPRDWTVSERMPYRKTYGLTANQRWSEALGLLECYPWHKLYPLQVHPEFRQRIFDTVISRYASEGSPNDHRIGRWEERCSKVCNS